jgi:hypothetical protein
VVLSLALDGWFVVKNSGQRAGLYCGRSSSPENGTRDKFE